MKLKQRPEDFQVEELTDVQPIDRGAFALYRLEKRGWSTPDALAAVRRRWQIDLNQLSFGGLKDRHAQTNQYFTIFHGPRRGLRHQDVTVHYLGQTPDPFTSRDIRANRFRILLRAVDPAAIPALEQALEEVRRDGVPNYFDDQRFGSAADGQFVARALVLGQFEEGLRLALTAPYEHDPASQKREKALLRNHWGHWAELKSLLPRGHAWSLVCYLADHPGEYRGAVARLRPDLRGLYLSAYQSHLWNRMLARWLTAQCRPDQRVSVSLRLGEVPMHRELEPDQRTELAALQLPLPSARLHLAAEDPHMDLVEAVLAEEGLALKQLQIKGIREMFFSKGERAGLCLPAELSWEIQPDELYPRQHQLLLTFDLPRGAYATLIVKRAQQAIEV